MEKSEFQEDERILALLQDASDREAFANLMAHAHAQGISAADFVREEPKRTSRQRIRKLCLKNRKRSLRLMVASVVKNLWDRPVQEPAEAFVQALYAPPSRPGAPQRNGHHEKKRE